MHGQINPNANIPWNEETRPEWSYEQIPEGEPVLATAHDRDSVMHYHITNDQTIGDYTVPVNYAISAGDAEWARLAYPQAGTVVLPPREPDDNDIYLPFVAV